MAFAALLPFALAPVRGLAPVAGTARLTGLVLLAALAAAFATHAVSIRQRGTWIRQELRRRQRVWTRLAALASLAFLGLYLGAVRGVPGRSASVLVGFAMQPECAQPAAAVHAGPNCAGDSVETCIQSLAFDQGAIDLCWGVLEMTLVKLSIFAAYLLTLCAGGALLASTALLARPEVRPLRVFISYRRADGGATSERLHGRLVERLGAGNVFKDDASLEPSRDWREGILRNLVAADAVLVVIGPLWKQELAAGPEAWTASHKILHQEIRTALAGEQQVVPLLVRGAPMVDARQLPDDIQAFAGLQALPIDDGAGLNRDFRRLWALLLQAPRGRADS